MGTQKIVIRVTETRYHKVELELPEDEMNSLIEELDSVHADDAAGDMCDDRSFDDGEWELQEYKLKETTAKEKK